MIAPDWPLNAGVLRTARSPKMGFSGLLARSYEMGFFAL
jgi:hypothetical protein